MAEEDDDIEVPDDAVEDLEPAEEDAEEVKGGITAMFK
jgi:hypothetical protein